MLCDEIPREALEKTGAWMSPALPLAEILGGGLGVGILTQLGLLSWGPL